MILDCIPGTLVSDNCLPEGYVSRLGCQPFSMVQYSDLKNPF